eukprot:2868832-Amphidinium_carterae.5
MPGSPDTSKLWSSRQAKASSGPPSKSREVSSPTSRKVTCRQGALEIGCRIPSHAWFRVGGLEGYLPSWQIYTKTHGGLPVPPKPLSLA